jgi:hypothetical protein
MVKLKSAPMILVCLVLIDIFCSFFFWSYCGMIENNPLMLWALQHGLMYWLFSLIKFLLVVILMWAYYKVRIAKLFTWILIVVYGLVWLQYFIGRLI